MFRQRRPRCVRVDRLITPSAVCQSVGEIITTCSSPCDIQTVLMELPPGGTAERVAFKIEKRPFPSRRSKRKRQRRRVSVCVSSCTPEDDVIAEWLLWRRRQGPKQPKHHQRACMWVCVCEKEREKVHSCCKYFAVFHGIAVVCRQRLPRQPRCHSQRRREGSGDVERGGGKDVFCKNLSHQ